MTTTAEIHPMPESARAALMAAFSRSHEYGSMPMLHPAEPGPKPDTSTVDRLTNAKAARVMERCNYVVTGFVLTHRTAPRKAIADMSCVRWFPNLPEYSLVMTGYKDVPGPGVPPPEATGDEVLAPAAQAASAPPIVLAAQSEAPTRPVLTAPPSARLLESTEEALGVLARELGCVQNEAIPHNAGWFVPGKPTAYASALDAIKGLVANLKAGGTVYEGKVVVAGEIALECDLASGSTTAAESAEHATMTGKPRKAASVDTRQGGLF